MRTLGTPAAAAPPQVRLERQQAALLSISRLWRQYEADAEVAIRTITETAGVALLADRASVWLLDDRRRSILCHDLYEYAERRHSSGAELSADDYPAYFEALASEEVIDAEDAHADPRTRDFSTSYLAPLGIGAMLDAPIRLGGRLIGVLCNEFTGGPRRFFPDEFHAATYLANLVSLALEFQRRAETERKLEHSVALLRAVLDATAEGVLAVDDRGHVTGHNRRLREFWNVSPELLEPGADGRAGLDRMAAQTTDPAGFLARIQATLGDPSRETVEVVETTSGRIFECTSRPQIYEGASIGRVWSYRDVTEQKQVEHALRLSGLQLQELALRDPLTGLYNRRFLEESLPRELARAQRTGGPLAVIMLDVDHFKLFNDHHGHEAGDQVLSGIGRFLTQSVRRGDIPYRYGGEEFLIVLPGLDEQAALSRAEDLRRGVKTLRIEHRHQVLPTISISVGVALAPHDGQAAPELISAADAALYAAKEGGRDRVALATPVGGTDHSGRSSDDPSPPR